MNKLEALTQHLDTDPNDIKDEDVGDGRFAFGSEEYLVLTDDEADTAVRECILDSVWAFRPSFLVAHMTDVTEKMVSIIQEQCEDANPVILRLIDDVDHFVDDAIAADGRGHFLASYDGEEYEVGEYFIYRVN